MGLNREDQLPNQCEPIDCYRRIYDWYKKNHSLLDDGGDDEYAKRSLEYIDSLVAPENASNDEMVDAFEHVIMNLLEWGYHQSDGEYKMAAYAHVGREKLDSQRG